MNVVKFGGINIESESTILKGEPMFSFTVMSIIISLHIKNPWAAGIF